MGAVFHVERSIAAPPARVWELLTDVAAWRSWNPTVVSIDGAIAPGGSVRLVSTVNPKRAFTLTVTAFEPPQRMTWSDGMPLGLFTGTRTYVVTPDPGGSVFSMTEAYTGPLAGLIGRSIPDLGPSFERFADGLRAAAEGPDPAR